jgi:hypothetical protein
LVLDVLWGAETEIWFQFGKLILFSKAEELKYRLKKPYWPG